MLDALLPFGMLVTNGGVRVLDEGLGGIAAANVLARADDPRAAWILLDDNGWAGVEREGSVDHSYPVPVPDLEARGGTVYRAAALDDLCEATGINGNRLAATEKSFNVANSSSKLRLLACRGPAGPNSNT